MQFYEEIVSWDSIQWMWNAYSYEMFLVLLLIHSRSAGWCNWEPARQAYCHAELSEGIDVLCSLISALASMVSRNPLSVNRFFLHILQGIAIWRGRPAMAWLCSSYFPACSRDNDAYRLGPWFAAASGSAAGLWFKTCGLGFKTPYHFKLVLFRFPKLNYGVASGSVSELWFRTCSN